MLAQQSDSVSNLIAHSGGVGPGRSLFYFCAFDAGSHSVSLAVLRPEVILLPQFTQCWASDHHNQRSLMS